MKEFVHEVEQELIDNDGTDYLLHIVVESTLEALCKTGILTELDGGIGYNGITTPKGVSQDFLSDNISDIFTEKMSEMAKQMIMEDVNGR